MHVCPTQVWLRAAFASSLCLAPGIVAQSPLALDVRAGSIPGALEMVLAQGSFFEPCVVFVGVDPGPTPLAILDPGDPRQLQVGTQAWAGFFGYFPMSGTFAIGPSAVPNAPNLAGLTFWFQGLTLGTVSLVDRLSNPAAVRLELAGQFHTRAALQLVDERAFAVAMPRDDRRWMVVGGGRGGLLALTAHRTTEIYDDVTDRFVPGPSMNTERAVHTATRLQDGRWLLVGGVDYNNDPQAACEVYDPAADVFAPVAPMATARMGHTATLLQDGRVLVAGGLTAITNAVLSTIANTTDTTEIYDPVANSWAPGPAMGTRRVGHVAIPRPDGRVLLAGGISYDLILVPIPTVRTSSDLYDPATNTRSAGPGMQTPHSLVDPVPLGGDRWLVAGGISSVTLTNPGTPTAVAEIYDAVANSWSSAGSMATPRGSQRTFPLGNGQWLAVGGANGTIEVPVALASGEVYDSAANSWSPGPSLSVPRAAAAAILTTHGQVHVMGGGTSLGAIATSSDWYYF